MADTKISDLTALTTAGSADVLPIVSSSETKKITFANLLASPNSHDHVGGDGAQIAHTGLSSIGTNTHAQIDTYIANLTPSFNGIQFPATQSPNAGANVLDDYEEGTWTPTYLSTGATFTYSEQAGHYTKIGNLVLFSCRLLASASGTTSNDVSVPGLPFVAANYTDIVSAPVSLCDFTNVPDPAIGQASSSINLWKHGVAVILTVAETGMNGGNKYLLCSGAYFV